MNSALASAGGMIFIIGLVITVFTYEIYILCSGPLILIGLILLIIGLIIPEEKSMVFQKPVTHQPSQNRYCQSCGRLIPFDANICPYCGINFSRSNIEYTKKYCSECGKQLEHDSKFCSNCGKKN